MTRSFLIRSSNDAKRFTIHQEKKAAAKNIRCDKSRHSILGGEKCKKHKKEVCSVDNTRIRRQKVVDVKSGDWLNATPKAYPEGRSQAIQDHCKQNDTCTCDACFMGRFERRYQRSSLPCPVTSFKMTAAGGQVKARQKKSVFFIFCNNTCVYANFPEKPKCL